VQVFSEVEVAVVVAVVEVAVAVVADGAVEVGE